MKPTHPTPKSTHNYPLDTFTGETRRELEALIENQQDQIRKDVIKIIQTAKATFFVKDKDVEIPPDELLYELRAEICTQVEMYFINLITSPTRATMGKE